MTSAAPIGVFDSGVGGLSIVRQLLRTVPGIPLLYLADQAHVPYGDRSLEEVRRYAYGITDYLLGQGANVIVVACNTASAAALHALRSRYPQTPFVGMEPAVKPAAQTTRSGVVGVLATPATFQGVLFASVVERFSAGARIMEQTLPGLVERIEAGDLQGPRTRAIVEQGLQPLLELGADTIVLACTHYPFIIPLLQTLVPNGVQVIDPSPAIARQTARVLRQQFVEPQETSPGDLNLLTTGDPQRLAAMAEQLIGVRAAAKALRWDADKLEEAS